MHLDISELLTLYDVVTFSFPEQYDDLMREIVEKATRLFGIRRLALILREGEGHRCLGRWGFRKDEEVLEKIKSNKSNGEGSFIYIMQNGVQGLLYMEPSGRISERDRRLFTIFACRIESIVARKQMEEKIRNSEREKKIILNSLMELLIFQDPDHRILWANRAAAEYAGMTPEELVGRTCYEAMSRRGVPCEECPVAKVWQSGMPEEGTVAFLRGRQFFVIGYPVKSETGSIEGIVEVCVDITERIQAEEAFQAVFNSVHDAIFLHQLDGTIIDVNQRMLQIYGVSSKEEAVKLSIIRDYSSPNSPVDQLQQLWEKAITGESLVFEWKARRPGDGSVFDAEVVCFCQEKNGPQ